LDGILYKIHFRPGVFEFLQKIIDAEMDIIIWSASSKKYVEEISYVLFRNLNGGPIALMCGDHLQQNPYSDYTKTFKEVKKVTGISEDRLLAVDDAAENFIFDRVYRIKPWYDYSKDEWFSTPNGLQCELEKAWKFIEWYHKRN
jgi:hypothetical protein